MPARRALLGAATILGVGCATGPSPTPAIEPQLTAADHTATAATAKEPLLPPQAAMLLGLLPRRSTGAEQFIAGHPTHDGRGVLIGILDSGIDAGVPGLQRTTTGDPKLLDLRDFSGEGRIILQRIEHAPDGVTVGGQRLRDFGRVVRLALPPYYGGVLVERQLGALPAADVNGDGDRDDALPLVVARGRGGWFLMADTDGDGSLLGERAVHDYAVAAETLSYGPLTLAANFGPSVEEPTLDLFFDNSGHGTHVAGIAAGHALFGVTGFDGVAPGAQLLGLKIADNARGGVSVSGSMLRAMEYAAAYAARRRMPLVLNLSFGVGNETSVGPAVIDSLVDAFALAHPSVLFVISAGNDGPGLASVGFPGSAEFALSACALFPGVFAEGPTAGRRPPPDVLGWWSGRGGVVHKPDLCVPGVAFSNVPPWHAGQEVSGGTSMAAPHLSGLAALLQSAVLQTAGQPRSAADVTQALRATASPLAGASTIDQGTGVPNVGAASRWLAAAHRAGRFRIRAQPDGGNTGWTAAFRRSGLATPGDTLQRFTVESVAGQPFARVLLRPDAPWLAAPEAVDFDGAPATVTVRYDAGALQAPGRYVGTVWARPATDTVGGAVFGLVNTIVVPYELAAPLTTRRSIPAGGAVSLYLRVPEDAGALVLRLTTRDPDRAASLYLFEPTGQPARTQASLEVGGQYGVDGHIVVPSEDLAAGVWEAVVVAPPTAGVTVDFEAVLPPVVITAVTPHAITLRNRGTAPRDAAVTARVVGAQAQWQVGGRGTVRQVIGVSREPWAADLEIDVEVTRAVWPRLTDFAVSLWDPDGRLVSEKPLNYATGRYRLSADSLPATPLDLELVPAFALAGDTTRWTASVRITSLTDPDAPPAMAHRVTLPAESEVVVPWMFTMPAPPAGGLRPVIEVRVTPTGAPATVRRLVLPRDPRTPGGTP